MALQGCIYGSAQHCKGAPMGVPGIACVHVWGCMALRGCTNGGAWDRKGAPIAVPGIARMHAGMRTALRGCSCRHCRGPISPVGLCKPDCGAALPARRAHCSAVHCSASSHCCRDCSARPEDVPSAPNANFYPPNPTLLSPKYVVLRTKHVFTIKPQPFLSKSLAKATSAL